MSTMERILRLMADKKASDVYLSAHSPALIKINGQALPINSQVLPPDATGSLNIGVANPRIVQLNGNGSASVAYHSPTYGKRGIVANYPGDATHDPAAAAIDLVFGLGTPTLTLSSSVTPAPRGQSVTLTAAMNPDSLPGTIHFFDQDAAIGDAPLVHGIAVINYPVPLTARACCTPCSNPTATPCGRAVRGC